MAGAVVAPQQQGLYLHAQEKPGPESILYLRVDDIRAAYDTLLARGDSESRVYFARVSGFATASALPDFFDGAAAAGFVAACGGFLRRSSSGENIAVYL
jgi:hypothetical protein